MAFWPRDLAVEDPRTLTYAVGIAAALLIIPALLRRRSTSWRATLVALVVRLLLVTLALALAASPHTTKTHEAEGAALLALDHSLSVDPAERALVAEALDVALGPRAHRTVLSFAERIRVQATGPKAGILAPLAEAGLSSDPHAALAILSVLPRAERGSSRLFLLSDGALPEPEEVLNVAALSPSLRPIAGAQRNEARLLSAAVDPPAEPLAPMAVRVQASSASEQSGEIALYCDGVFVRKQTVPLPAGESQFVLPLPTLEPGDHLVALGLSVAGDPEFDNRAATSVTVTRPFQVTSVAEPGRSAVVDALRAQGISVKALARTDFLVDPRVAMQSDVLLMQGVAAAELSSPPVLAAIRRFVERGGGMVYIPRTERGEIFDAGKKPFLALLPLQGAEPPPLPPPPKPEEPALEDPPAGVFPPDPEARNKEKRAAPSLGLALLVDASASMDGMKLLLAKEAAVAAAEVLHPEDRVAVIAFNTEARVVFEMGPAKDLPLIRERIGRIQARGGTNFTKALELVEEVFAVENLAIKHAILLSDGEPNDLRPVLPLAKDLAEKGVTVSTVGCGPGFAAALLSDIALHGGGKFHPAPNPMEVPQIFTIEAERVIKQSGARSRRDAKAEPAPPKTDPPKPKPDAKAKEPPPPPPPEPMILGKPAPYVRGIRPHTCSGVLGRHLARPRLATWVALATEDRGPVLAHGYLGKGRIAMSTVGFEGENAVHLVAWDDYPVLLAQLVRFLARQDDGRRLYVTAETHDRAVLVRVLDAELRNQTDEDYDLHIADERGQTVSLDVERLGRGELRLRVPPSVDAAALDLRIVGREVDPDTGERPEGRGFAVLNPPPELASAGVNLPRLEAWASALGGSVDVRPQERVDIPDRRWVEKQSFFPRFLGWMLVLLFLDLANRRFLSGRGSRA